MTLSEYNRKNPFGNSISIDEIVENFSYLDNWEDKYRLIIELGNQLPHLPDELKKPEHLVHGCQSQVWIAYQHLDNRYQFGLDSDAHIVRGLIAIILSALNNKSAEEIHAYDIEALFQKLGLLQHLSPLRGNGLRAMVERIRKLSQPSA